MNMTATGRPRRAVDPLSASLGWVRKFGVRARSGSVCVCMCGCGCVCVDVCVLVCSDVCACILGREKRGRGEARD